MSQNNEEDKRQRSVKLCQFVWDREIDKEIGFEIRKLLEEGVLIDFQDQNRNKKTAIHLAVEKRDVISVRFLLQFKPCLKVKDEDGKTPVELATILGDQSILNALINSSVDVVNESFIEVFDFQSLSAQKIEAVKSRPTFKVLKLTNCPSANVAWDKLNDQTYNTALQESSHLFFIAIEMKETSIENDDELMKKVLNLRRPMIVQLTALIGQTSKFHFKDNEKDFVEITDAAHLTQDEFDEAIESEAECNLKLLVAAFRSNLFGRFTGNLLDTKLNTDEDRNEAVNKFAKSNALCHRFFKLFDESQPSIDRIVATLSFKGDESLLALLDLPFDSKDEKLKPNEFQQDILNVVDSSGCNLLMIAIEQGNLDALKLLLRCGCDFNRSDNYDKRASDICWEMKDLDCLAELIEAGSPYPSNFRIDKEVESSEAHERINAMVEAIYSFHKRIKQGETEEVKKFIASHPNVKHAFDTNNKCALTLALQSNRVDIFSLLMSKGFEPGADDEYCDALDKSKFKNEIRNSHRKYFKEAFNEPHLKRLLKMFRLSFGSKGPAKCSKIIRKMFDELNEIDEAIAILKICSLSDKLRIVFDFNCDSVVDMDPTKESSSLGAVYPSDGFIYVGAKNHETEFCAVIGNLIHELTHYAMKLTYENSCKPFFKDTESEKRFDEITTVTKLMCDGNPSTDAIIGTVFSSYNETVSHQELIVRVPHLLAHHKLNPKALKAAQRDTPELFHFYREKTLKDVDTQSQTLLQEYLISKINNQTGIARKIENLKVKFGNVEIILKPSVYVITSNAPQLTLAMLNQFYHPGSHIFVTLEQVATGNILDKIAKVNAKESSTALIVDCIEKTQKHQESLRKLLKNMKNIKTIALVMTATESSKVKENFPELESKTFDHKWGELTESSKFHLLSRNVIFQGFEMKLNELVEPSSEAMNFFPLGELLDCKDFKIDHELHQTTHKFYIARKFTRKDQTIIIEKGRKAIQRDAKSFEELLRDESRIGAMIISDEAGSGKSVTLFEIAKSLHAAFPNRWVLFVDLKRHIEAFKSIQDFETIDAFEDFIEQHLLKIEVEFDRELFKEMFHSGKTFVLFDGFDEISPNYKDLLLHVLKLFQARSGNQLFITTRPHLEEDLEGVLGNFVFKLEEFSEESKTSFLREYWRSVKFEINRNDFEDLSNRLLDFFSKISASKLIGLPLLMRMTAEIFGEPSREKLWHKVDSLSISSVFEKFVEKHLARWTNNENEIARNETVEFVMAGGILEVHHNIAINQIFDEEFLSLDIDGCDAEKISRVGLIRFDKTEKTFQFIHQTFAEYFVADFIWLHLNRKNRNPAHECSKAIQTLCEVLLSYDFKARVIRDFLDNAVASTKFSPSEAVCESIANRLSETLKIRNRFDFLGRNVEASRQNLASLLLAIVKHIEKDVLLKVLQSRSCSVDSVLLDTAAFMSSTTVSALCDIITTCTINPKEIYQELGYYKRNALSRAAVNQNFGVLTTLCANLNSFLTKNEIKAMLHRKGAYGQNIITIASDNNNSEVFLELISLLPNYLSPDEIKSLMLAVDGSNNNFFHRALIYNTNVNLKIKFDAVKSNFDIDQQKAFFYRTTTAQNMFQYVARNRNQKIFETLIDATREVLSNDEIKFMLMEKDYRGLNVLHHVANHGNVVVLNDLNSLLRERLSDDEIRNLLLEVNEKGKNCFRLASNNTKLSLQVFCDIIGNLLSLEDQTRLLQASSHEIDITILACGNNTMEIVSVESDEAIRYLLTKENHGRNVLHDAARGGNVDTWNKLISFAQARFSDDEMKSFLFGSDINGENCLHLAICSSSRANMVDAVCKTIKSAGWSVEDQKTFVRQKDSRKKNIFHHAATCFHILDKCFSLLHGLSTILSKDEIKEMLKEKDSRGNNFLFYNLVSCDLMLFLREALPSDEIKSLLFEVDREGRNFFHCTVERSSKSEITSLSKAIKAILSQDERKKFFGIEGRNVFHLAARNPNSGIFSTTHECLKDVLTEHEIKSLILEKNCENRNVIHLICQHAFYDSDKRLHDLLKILKVSCDVDKLKNFLTSNNCLILAAQFQNPLFFKEMLSFIRSALGTDDQRDLIKKCEQDGKNILSFVSRKQNPEINSLIENFANEILTKNQIKELKNQNRFVKVKNLFKKAICIVKYSDNK